MRKMIDVTSYNVEFKNLPTSFHGCRIGFLADLHNNEIGANNEILLSELKKQRPDYILCGGDMIVGSHRGVCEYDRAIDFLKEAVKIAPVFFSFGNHEERLRNPELFETSLFELFLERLERIGVHVLDNYGVQLVQNGDTISIKGLSIDMECYKRWWNRVPLSVSQITTKIGRKDGFTILLAHNPVYFKSYDSYGGDLVLAGHVHGGLMVLPFLGGVISPELALFPKYDAGYFKGKYSQMIVSRGLGVHTLPIRINNRPEVIMITLKKTCDFNGQLVE